MSILLDSFWMIFVPIILGAFGLLVFFFFDKQRRDKENAEKQQLIAQQQEEWEEQLRLYPWLRHIIQQHEFFEGQIELNLYRSNEGRIVRAEIIDPANHEVLIFEEDQPVVERQVVDWRRDGF